MKVGERIKFSFAEGEKEGVMIELISILHSTAVHLGRHPAGVYEAGSLQGDAVTVPFYLLGSVP